MDFLKWKYINFDFKISLQFVLKCLMENIATLVQIMSWRRPGDKPLSEPMMFFLLTHIWVTRPQWVKSTSGCHGTYICASDLSPHWPRLTLRFVDYSALSYFLNQLRIIVSSICEKNSVKKLLLKYIFNEGHFELAPKCEVKLESVSCNDSTGVITSSSVSCLDISSSLDVTTAVIMA